LPKVVNNISVDGHRSGLSRCSRAAWKWIFLLALLLSNHVFADGNWLKLGTSAPGSVSFMLLLSDGTVMAAHNPIDNFGEFGQDWFRLVPDPNGHYVLGEWTNMYPMTYVRHAFASQVLPDGRVFIAGGEHPEGGAGEASAEIYDPRVNRWALVNPPASMMDGTQVSPGLSPVRNQGFVDCESAVLGNGTVLLAPEAPSVTNGTLIYNPAANTWSQGPATRFWQAEVSWVNLPDGSVLTVDPGTNNTERYIPELNKWVRDADLPIDLWAHMGPKLVSEIGPAFMLPNGKAFFLGGSGHTAIYTPSGATNAGRWDVGPDIPNGLSAADAPAAMMPNGKILCAVAGLPSGDSSGNPSFPAPTSFYEYDYLNGSYGNFIQVTGPTGVTDNVRPQDTSMLVLPDGSVLYCHIEEGNLFYDSFGSQLYVYVPIGAQVAAGAPSITSIVPGANGTFHLTGYNLNGFSQGAAFGDDAQMGTGFPIVQFRDTNNTHIDYARTFNWTLGGGAYGAGSVDFTLPPGLIPQTYQVSVSANGVISDPVIFSFVNPSFLALCPGESGTLSVITTPQPATYQWLRNNNPLNNQTNAQLNIVNATTNDAGIYTLQVFSGTGSTVSLPVPVSVGVMEVSQPPPTNSAALCQPASLSIVARGKGTLSAQWFHNGALMAADSRITLTNFPAANGATQFLLIFSDVHYEDDATYHVVITDACGAVTEPSFSLRVTPNPPWVRVATDGPPSRHNAAMCYDSYRKVTVLFGGGTWAAGPAGVLGDTWEFDGTNWTQRLPVTSPVGRYQANMVYDSALQRTVLFGGLRYDQTYGVRFSPETWIWDGNNWYQIATDHLPPWTETQYPYASCYDSVRGEMLLFGFLHDPLWSFDGNDWHPKNVGGSGPQYSPADTAMAFDTNRGVAVLPVPSGFSLAIWEWNGTNWLAPEQSGQQPNFNNSGPSLTYDTFRQECVFFGEEAGTVDGHQTTDLYSHPDSLRFLWRWNGKQWQADPPTPTVGVASEINHTMCFDSARNALVMFGGQGEGSFDVTNYTYEILYQDSPEVLKQPTYQNALLGQNATLAIVAVGAPVISYQWQKNGVPLTDTGHVLGTTSDTLQLTSVTAGDAGTYAVVLNNICGTTNSRPIQFVVTTGSISTTRNSGPNAPLMISWSGPGFTLQHAPAATGPWTDVIGATSPYPAAIDAQQQFFRVRN
jgi:hypothetical protein